MSHRKQQDKKEMDKKALDDKVRKGELMPRTYHSIKCDCFRCETVRARVVSERVRQAIVEMNEGFIKLDAQVKSIDDRLREIEKLIEGHAAMPVVDKQEES